MAIYTIKHGSIAAVQYVTKPDGAVVYVTDSKDDLDLPKLPLEVQAAVNRQFGIIFSLPYERRQAFIDSSIPFSVEVDEYEDTDDDTYDEWGVNTKNSFNTPTKGQPC